LDKILADSGEAWLIQELSYTAQNERDNVVPKIEINGNIRNSYATIKKAVRLYFEMYELYSPISLHRLFVNLMQFLSEAQRGDYFY